MLKFFFRVTLSGAGPTNDGASRCILREKASVHYILCQTLEKKDITAVLFFLGLEVGVERDWPRSLCVWSMELKKKNENHHMGHKHPCTAFWSIHTAVHSTTWMRMERGSIRRSLSRNLSFWRGEGTITQKGKQQPEADPEKWQLGGPGAPSLASLIHSADFFITIA